MELNNEVFTENLQTMIKDKKTSDKSYSKDFLEKFMNNNLNYGEIKNNILNQDKNKTILDDKDKCPININNNKYKTIYICDYNTNFSFKKKNLSIQPHCQTESFRTITEFSPINNKLDLSCNDKKKYIKKNEDPNNVNFESIFEKKNEEKILNSRNIKKDIDNNSLKDSNFHNGKVDLKISESEILKYDKIAKNVVEENIYKNFDLYPRTLQEPETDVCHKLDKYKKTQNKNLSIFHSDKNNAFNKVKNSNTRILNLKIKCLDPLKNLSITSNEYTVNGKNIKNFNKINNKWNMQSEICNIQEDISEENDKNAILHKDLIVKYSNEKIKNDKGIKFKFKHKIESINSEKTKFNKSYKNFPLENKFTKNNKNRLSNQYNRENDEVINLKLIFGSKEKLLYKKIKSDKNILNINNCLYNDHKFTEKLNSLNKKNIIKDKNIENDIPDENSLNNLMNYKNIISKNHNKDEIEKNENFMLQQRILSDFGLKTLGTLKTIESERPPKKLIKIDKLKNNNSLNLKNSLKNKLTTSNQVLHTISNDLNYNLSSKLYGKKNEKISNKKNQSKLNHLAIKIENSDRKKYSTHKNFEQININYLKDFPKQYKTLENVNTFNRENNLIKNNSDSLSNITNGIKNGSSKNFKLRKKSFNSKNISKIINNYVNNKKKINLQINEQEKDRNNKLSLREKETIEYSNHDKNYKTFCNFTSTNENLIKINKNKNPDYLVVYEKENTYKEKSKIISESEYCHYNSKSKTQLNLKNFVSNNQNSMSNIIVNKNSQSFEKNNEKYLKSDLILDAQNILESLKLYRIPENIDFNEYLKTDFFDRSKNQNYFNYSMNNFINKDIEVEKKEDIKVINNSKDTLNEFNLDLNGNISAKIFKRSEFEYDKIVKNKYRALIDNFLN